MNRMRILLVVAVVTVSSVVGLNAQQKDTAWAVSQAPADSLFVVGSRNFGSLWTNLKQWSGQGDKIPNFPAMMEMQMPQGIDLTGPVAIMMLSSGERTSIVVMSQMKPGAAISGDKVDGGITKVVSSFGTTSYALQMAPWVAMSDNQASLQAMSAAKTRLVVTAQQKNDINGRSVWAWVNTKALTAKLKASIPQDLQQTDVSPAEPNHAALANSAISLLNQVSSLTAALDVKPEAAALTVGLEYAPNSQLALLASAGLPIASYKAGLPATDQLLVAGWGRTDWVKMVAPTKAIIMPFMDTLIPASNADARKSLDAMWVIYAELAATLGNEAAFVMKPAPIGEGVYHLAETFAVKNPDAFRKTMAKAMPMSEELTKAISNLGPAGSATPQMDMKVDYKPSAETIDGVAVDVISTKITPAMSPDEQEAAQKMVESMYGPEGMTMRMAVVGRTAVVSMGGKNVMGGALKAAKGQTPDLAGNPKVAAALARVSKSATFAGVASLPAYAYFTINMVQRMVAGAGNPTPSIQEPAMGDLVTFSLRMQGNTQYFDLNVPQSEVLGVVGILEQMNAGSGRTRPSGGRGPVQGAPAPVPEDE
ncbi:MAG: hypothetical protein WCL44_03040 [bacterium]